MVLSKVEWLKLPAPNLLRTRFIVLRYIGEYRIFGQVPVDRIHRHQVSEYRIFGQVLLDKIHRQQVSEYRIFGRIKIIDTR